MNKKYFITVKNQFDDIHCYPNAPEEVKFLQNEHRHTFMVESTIQVFHEDRELEFYIVKDFIETLIPKIKNGQISKSCENIASFILDELYSKYSVDQSREITVSVSEDGQNKATVEYK